MGGRLDAGDWGPWVDGDEVDEYGLLGEKSGGGCRGEE
jgi:hypothetical protein